MLLFALAFLAAAGAEPECAWLNAATASGILGGAAESLTKSPERCEWIRGNQGRSYRLRIGVSTEPNAYKKLQAGCGAHASPIRAVGNEALRCDLVTNAAGRTAEVIGRVRDQAFSVEFSTDDSDMPPAVLFKKAEETANHVAGILF